MTTRDQDAALLDHLDGLDPSTIPPATRGRVRALARSTDVDLAARARRVLDDVQAPPSAATVRGRDHAAAYQDGSVTYEPRRPDNLAR